jgi:beta-lactam-binding protein with PASTA domain
MPMLAVIAMTVAFAMIVMGIIRFIGESPPIVKGAIATVPSLMGKTVAEASKMARDQDTELIVVGERESDRYAAGQIMHQTPVPGWRPYDRQPIRVTVSSGVLAPNLVGRGFADGAKQANELGWKIARVETAPGTGQAPTTVIMQFPPPGNLVNQPGEIALVIAE